MKQEYYGVMVYHNFEDILEINDIVKSRLIPISDVIHEIYQTLGDVFTPETGIFTKGCVEPLLTQPIRSRLPLLKETHISDCVGYTICAIIQDYFNGIVFKHPQSEIMDIRRYLDKGYSVGKLTLKLTKLINLVERILVIDNTNLIAFRYRNDSLIIEIGQDYRIVEFIKMKDLEREVYDQKLEAGLIDVNELR